MSDTTQVATNTVKDSGSKSMLKTYHKHGDLAYDSQGRLMQFKWNEQTQSSEWFLVEQLNSVK